MNAKNANGRMHGKTKINRILGWGNFESFIVGENDVSGVEDGDEQEIDGRRKGGGGERKKNKTKT